MKTVEDVVRRHVSSRVLVEASVSGVTVTIIFEVTQSLEGLLEEGCGFIPSKEMQMVNGPGLASCLGLLISLEVLPRRGGAKERVQCDVYLLHVS